MSTLTSFNPTAFYMRRRFECPGTSDLRFDLLQKACFVSFMRYTHIHTSQLLPSAIHGLNRKLAHTYTIQLSHVMYKYIGWYLYPVCNICIRTYTLNNTLMRYTNAYFSADLVTVRHP